MPPAPPPPAIGSGCTLVIVGVGVVLLGDTGGRIVGLGMLVGPWVPGGLLGVGTSGVVAGGRGFTPVAPGPGELDGPLGSGVRLDGDVAGSSPDPDEQAHVTNRTVQ